MNPIIKIPTTGDLQLNVQKTECYSTTDKGRHQIEDEICLLVSGKNSESDEIVEEFVTISREEARNLTTILLELANK